LLVALLALLRRWRRRHMRGNLTGSGIGGTTARAGGALSVDGLAASCVTGAAVAGTAAAGAVSSGSKDKFSSRWRFLCEDKFNGRPACDSRSRFRQPAAAPPAHRIIRTRNKRIRGADLAQEQFLLAAPQLDRRPWQQLAFHLSSAAQLKVSCIAGA
jgi:hypothetical protein